jgi:hypothetical protein
MNKAVSEFLSNAAPANPSSVIVTDKVPRIYKGGHIITDVELADELGIIQQQIEALEAVADNIKERMAKCGPGLYFGDEHKARVYWDTVTKLDVDRIRREMGDAWMSDRMVSGPCIMCESSEISLQDIERYRL